MEDVKLELANSENPTIIVDKVYKSRNNPQEYSTLQLRWKTKRNGGGSNPILGMFLKGGISEEVKRVAFQTIHNDFVKEYGITEGCNLNEKLPETVRLTIKEITQNEYAEMKALDTTNVIGFLPKKNPTSGEYLVNDEGYVFRGTFVTGLDEEDVYVSHTGSIAEEPDFLPSSESKEEVAESDDIPA